MPSAADPWAISKTSPVTVFVTGSQNSLTAAAISLGLQDSVSLGALDAERDWGYAPEYVDAMWRMLQQPESDDFVLATGQTHSVQDFLESAFQAVNLDWHDYVKQDSRYMRPSEVLHLVGDSSKAKDKLGWSAETMLPQLASIMVQSDLDMMRER